MISAVLTSLGRLARRVLGALGAPRVFDGQRGGVALPRRKILFVTIDRDPHQRGHEPNVARLRALAADHGLVVERRYMTDVGEDDRSVMFLFLAGSFPEWREIATDARWNERLERFGAFVRTTHLPILAVCGSHQLIAASYAGWGAVGHVRGPGDTTSRSIADEIRTGASLIPAPRLGEVGAFPHGVRTPADPLFEGLGPVAYLVHSHHDEVLEETRSHDFDSLLDPIETAPSADDGLVARSRVQALRLRRDDRLVYTLQFHPDLPSSVLRPQLVSPREDVLARADADGERLLRNFIRMAERFATRAPTPLQASRET